MFFNAGDRSASQHWERFFSAWNGDSLSSYTPKHSVEFSRWQEEHREGMPQRPGVFLQDADPQGNPVMLTPADKNTLSDFSSEPALYF
ncbi:hypothetical protein JRQ81_008580 [Phrynocephalus forsythii]|uniref:Uncharacterized protein n=1 Tax=Phrynocephalus forsythii TaxID=171643 RepID=A0A9Q1ASU4_9SAUR|nr:hypothetical protein JRQ81_008580 [Phrynocephalus forsythii]